MLTKGGRFILALLVTGLFIAPFDVVLAHDGFDHGLLPPAELQLNVGGPSITDLQKRKAALETKLKDDEAAKKKKQEEQAKLDAQIKELNEQINGIEAKIRETQATITETEAAITEIQRQINEKEAELAHQRDEQAESLRVIYETGNPSALEILVGSTSLSEFLTYQDYLDALEQHIEQTIETIEKIKAELEAKKAELDGKRAELGKLQVQQQAYRKGLAGQRAEKDRLLANAKAAEQSLTKQIAEAKQVYADVDSELAKLQEAARRRAEQEKANGTRAKVPPGVSGVNFALPVTYRYISCQFGCQTPFQNFHTGTDFVNYAGTEIKASADGVITHIGRLSYGYGQFVVISHNQRYSTISAHMQEFANIREGQSVVQGEVIGYIGSTGWSTGPHIHFEVRDYGVPVDPLDYM